jgi:hypothetical protein
MVKKSRADYSPEMQAWAWQWNFCFRCRARGQWPYSLEIHHFCRGSSRHKNDPKTAIILCWDCHHAREHGRLPLGLLGCLALKQRYDPTQYDLAHVCMVRHWAPTAITQEEVDLAFRALEAQT